MPQAIALNQAINIINDVRRNNSANQAIWQMLANAQTYLEKQMTAELHRVI
jgi:predicted Zn-dependent protease